MNKETKIILKNSLVFSIAPFLPKVVNILLLPIMTKYLTATDYGISATISAYSQALGAFSLLGFGVVLQNTYFKSPETYKETWRHIYGFLNLWLVIYAIVQAVILFFFIPDSAQENKWLIIILTNFSTVFFGATGTIGNSYYVYSKQSVPVIWRSILASFSTIAVNFILIVYLKMGYMGWYIGSFVGTFISNSTYWYVVNKQLGIKPKFCFDWKIIKYALKVGVPTIPHYYSSYMLEGAGRMVMDRANVSQNEIGRISISQQISDLFNQGMTGLNNAISPYAMTALKQNNSKRVNQILYIFIALVFSLAFTISIWSKEILSILLSNESLSSAYPYLILYIMAFCYRPLYLIASYYFFYFEETKKLLGVSLVSGFIAIIFYLLLIPKFGVLGFLIGHYIACLYYGYSGYLFKVYKAHSAFKPHLLLIMSIQIILTLLAYYLVDHMLAKSLLTFVVLLLITIILYYKQKQLKSIFK